MKFEMLLLRSLFVAGMLVCGLVFGAMLIAQPGAARLAAQASAGSATAAALGCGLPPDGLVCLRRAA